MRDAPQVENIKRDAVGADDRNLLRFVTCGSVDDGKSTLIGRVLYETNQVPLDELAAVRSASRHSGLAGDDIDYALFVDGLEHERQQGITIDVAYRYFSTRQRAFIVADCPGHQQYTRNMATGASNSELAVILVDARKGVSEQTRRHAFICSLLGIRHVVLAISKCDLVDYSRETYDGIVAAFASFSKELSFESVMAIPLSARHGDNIATLSAHTPWYQGRPLISYLETCDVGLSAGEPMPFRFSVQRVSRPSGDFRGYAGTPASGTIRVGNPIVSALSGRTSRVQRIVTSDGDRNEAAVNDPVTLVLEDEIDVSRGDLLAQVAERPEVSDQFAANVIWMSEAPLLANRSYLMRIGHRWVPANITDIKHKIDVNTLQHLAAKQLAMNEVAVCNIATASAVAFDPYAINRQTGAFILVDRLTNETVAAGMILFGLRRATNIHKEDLIVDKASRSAAKHQRPTVLWFTGLSGSGKSTLAKNLEKRLHDQGHHTYVLDGDNVRHGLNRDLGFTDADRVENIRRIGEVAKLFTDAGLIVLCSFISPFRAERRSVRELLGEGEFIEIFVDAPLDECQRRDPKGLYAKAEAGKIKNFTGIDSPYELPENAELHLRTDAHAPDELVDRIIRYLKDNDRI